MHKLHKEICDKIEHNNVNYKLRADLRMKFKTFNVGDFVMIRICSERFPLGTFKKLNAHSAGLLKS